MRRETQWAEKCQLATNLAPEGQGSAWSRGAGRERWVESGNSFLLWCTFQGADLSQPRFPKKEKTKYALGFPAPCWGL